MELLFYSGKNQQYRERVLNIIRGLVPEKKIGNYTTVENLCNRLRQFRDDKMLAILMTATQEELVDVILIHDLLVDIPIILVLPNREKETISKGTKLHPRFISYMDSDFSDIQAVLEKMVVRLNS
jgi:hypothetical protein